MNQPKFKLRLLLRVLAALHDTAPAVLAEILERSGFRLGDVTFRRTQTGQTWTELNRWPWGAE